MAEYIEKSEVWLEIQMLPHNGDMISSEEVEEAIKSIPAADVVEVKHGEWVLGHVEPGYFTPGGNRPWVCSECGKVISWMLDRPRENYCPNCGAKMAGGKNDA